MIQPPLLFLDIDGVLFLGVSTLGGLHDSDPFNKKCVLGLNEIIKKTGCEIVITSSWQNCYNLKELKEIFDWNGVMHAPMQLSSPDPDLMVRHDKRSREVLEWLSSHSKGSLQDDLKWCAVDDLDMSSELENFVKCDPNVGLGDKEVVLKAVGMLSA